MKAKTVIMKPSQMGQLIFLILFPFAHLCFACQAANSCASRSALIPARNFACLAAGCCLNHSRAAVAVSLTGRKVSPLLRAFLLARLLKPVSGPCGATQTGMSYHACTF